MREGTVLIGAGSAMFTRGLVADMIRRRWQGELALVDVDEKALEVAERMARKMLTAGRSALKLRAATDRRSLLKDATAVVCTIGVGGRRAWEQDVFVPRKHGIFQPVGDSVSPGGTSRALRMIPPMVGVARDVLELCPQALFFNYGNPMGPVCRGVRRATGAKVVGLCHGVNEVARFLASALGAPQEKLRYTAVGMNHLTWFTEVRIDGQDALPRLIELARRKLADPAPTDNRFSWQMLELVGAFPAVLDRHVVEFFPHLFCRQGGYFGKTLGVDAIGFEQAIAHGDRIFQEMQEMARSPSPLPDDYLERIGGEHEQVTEIIESIRRDEGRVFSANLPNTGQVPNLPAEAIVECPCVADAGGLRPIAQPPLAPAIAGTLATRMQWVETVVEAALEGSRRKFIQALLLDGAVTSVDHAERLADDLLAAQAAFLPQFRKSE